MCEALYIAGVLVILIELQPRGMAWWGAVLFAACWPLIPVAWVIGRRVGRGPE